jgi:hypothetical protein
VDRRKQSQAEAKALEKIMANEPRDDSESMQAYLARVSAKVGDQLAKDNAEREQKMVDDLAKKFRQLAGGMLDDVIERLLNPPKDEAPALDENAAKEAAPQATKH